MANSAFSRAYDLLFVITLLLILPFASAFTAFNYAAAILTPQNTLRRRLRATPRFRPKTVVITGVSTATGLRVARALWQTGHNIVGADTKTGTLFPPARFSRAIRKVYTLRPPYGEFAALNYIEDLVRVVEKEHADIWIDCTSSVSTQTIAQCQQLVQRKTRCQCVSADMETMDHFRNTKQLLNFVKSRGLPTPESHVVKSRDEIHTVLSKGHGKTKYLLQAPEGTNETSTRTRLPRRNLSQTYNDVSQIKVASTNPWVLEEDVEDRLRYHSCAIIVHGKLKAFAASVESEVGCQALPAETGLCQAMAHFVDSLATELGRGFSSHMYIKFCVEEKVTHSGVVQQILPLEGRLAASRELLLFTGKGGPIDLAHAYLASLLTPTANGSDRRNGTSELHDRSVGFPSPITRGVFAFDEDLTWLFLTPLLRLFTFQCSPKSLFKAWTSFLVHLLFWQEAFYAFWDPLPMLCNYFLNLPFQVAVKSQAGNRTRRNESI